MLLASSEVSWHHKAPKSDLATLQPTPAYLWLLTLRMLSPSALPSILLLADPLTLAPWEAEGLDSPATHVTLIKSLPSEFLLPVCDVLVRGWSMNDSLHTLEGETAVEQGAALHAGMRTWDDVVEAWEKFPRISGSKLEAPELYESQ